MPAEIEPKETKKPSKIDFCQIVQPFNREELEKFIAKEKGNSPRGLFKEYDLDGKRIIISLEALDSCKSSGQLGMIEHYGLAPFGEVSRKITVSPDGTRVEGDGFLVEVIKDPDCMSSDRELLSVSVGSNDQKVVGKMSPFNVGYFWFGFNTEGILIPGDLDLVSNLHFTFLKGNHYPIR